MQPEEPTEWISIPAEHVRPRTGAESLADPADQADSLDLLGGTVSSVVIEVPVASEPPAPLGADVVGDAD